MAEGSPDASDIPPAGGGLLPDGLPSDPLTGPATVLPGLLGALAALVPFIAAAWAARRAGPGWWQIAAPVAGLLAALAIGLVFQGLVGVSPRFVLVMVQGYADLLLPF